MSIDRGRCADVEVRGLWSQHPARDPQRLLVDAIDSDRTVGAARFKQDIDRATGERVESVVDDDRRTNGILTC